MDPEDRLADLMTAYQAGELAAFEELYSHLRPRLLGYLAAQTLHRTRAEDLLQETFLQIHRSRRTFLRGRPVIPWAFAIARHVYLMERRRSRRKEEREVPKADDLPELPIPPEAEALADSDQLQQALAKLSGDRREALLLHHVWGLSFKEVGTTLGIRTGTAKLRAHRGILELRKLLRVSSVT